MAKTDTIKQRAIYVYLPSIDMTERWKDLAEKQGASISKFVIEHVENSLMQEEDSGYKSRRDLWKEIKELKDQADNMKREKRVLELANDRLEQELRRYRAMPFLEEEFVGVRRYQKELVDLLRGGGSVSSNEILSTLGIDPSEEETVKAISKQLENLEGYGLVQSSPRGWMWRK